MHEDSSDTQILNKFYCMLVVVAELEVAVEVARVTAAASTAEATASSCGILSSCCYSGRGFGSRGAKDSDWQSILRSV